jgi:L-asparaginase II
MSHAPAIVRATRHTTAGPALETLHRVHIAVTTASGEVIGGAGDTSYTTPLRSCLKPFQAQALFASGAFTRFAVSSSELALSCASHEGALAHTTQVAAWLERLGLSEAALQCGAHPPGDKEAQATLVREGRTPTALHNNCSGKHTGMLASALALGADPKTYLHARHPVQLAIRERILRHMPTPLVWGVDGCSAPTPLMPLASLSTLFARLLAAAIPGGGVDDPDLALTARAMIEHPELVGGRSVLDTRLMRSIGARVEGVGPGALLCKRGADGVYALAYRHPKLGPVGLALKVEDGSELARAPAVLASLDRLGAITPPSRVALSDLIRPERLNHRGLLVGHLEVDVSLDLPAP